MGNHITVDVLGEYTNDSKIKNEILVYAKNKFVCNNENAESHYKKELIDETFVNSWYEYLKKSETLGVFKTLQHHLVQLQFSIAENISKSDSYRSATLQGKNTSHMLEAKGLILKDPKGIKLQVYASIGGKIPILIVDDNDDFKSLIRALCYKNEPVEIPDSMGAIMINGLNNWSKINVLKDEFLTSNTLSNWPNYFKNQIIPNTFLYKDKIILLSTKPYSNVPAKAIGCNKEDWINHSLKIRLEHECAHYFTLRKYGIMSNNMHDEIIADYAGICASHENYQHDWFLKFIGLEEYPKYRKGARLENYLGSPKLSEGAFEVLKTIIYKAVMNIKKFDIKIRNRTDRVDKVAVLMSLCSLDIVEMSQHNGAEKLFERFNSILKSNTCTTLNDTPIALVSHKYKKTLF